MNLSASNEQFRMNNAHGIDSWKLYDKASAVAVEMLIRPGQALKPHLTPVDVFFYVLEGEGVVQIGEEEKSVGCGTGIDSPADIVHCWRNESEHDLRILVFKAPRPVKKTRFV